MNQRRAANEVVTLALGALLVADSWDGLYEWLALPQALPALLAQFGGVFLVAFAYLLWRAAAATVRCVGRWPPPPRAPTERPR